MCVWLHLLQGFSARSKRTLMLFFMCVKSCVMYIVCTELIVWLFRFVKLTVQLDVGPASHWNWRISFNMNNGYLSLKFCSKNVALPLGIYGLIYVVCHYCLVGSKIDYLLFFVTVKKDFELARRIGGKGQPWWENTLLTSTIISHFYPTEIWICSHSLTAVSI